VVDVPGQRLCHHLYLVLDHVLDLGPGSSVLQKKTVPVTHIVLLLLLFYEMSALTNLFDLRTEI
jgi:hypothetical protein